jgi:hypothetical protein
MFLIWNVTGVCIEPLADDFRALMENRPRCVTVNDELGGKTAGMESIGDNEGSRRDGIDVSRVVDDQELSHIDIVVLRCTDCHAKVT